MPKLIISNRTNNELGIGGIVGNLGPTQQKTLEVSVQQLENIKSDLDKLVKQNLITLSSVNTESAEDDHADGVVWSQLTDSSSVIASREDTRVLHRPTITPADAEKQPGQGPVPLVLGSVIGLHFDNIDDAAYRILKIDTSFVGEASFHVHWTKAVDSNEQGNTVRWVLSYVVFNGSTEEVALATPTVINMDDTYEDSGTTTRIVHRTANFTVTNLVANYYIGLKLTYDSINTTLLGGPVVISTDLLYRAKINEPG